MQFVKKLARATAFARGRNNNLIAATDSAVGGVNPRRAVFALSFGAGRHLWCALTTFFVQHTCNFCNSTIEEMQNIAYNKVHRLHKPPAEMQLMTSFDIEIITWRRETIQWSNYMTAAYIW